MQSFVALLRAVNVAGHGRLGMADLRGVASALGFEDVRTLIQSGNLVFRGKGAPPVLEKRLASEVEKELGVRTEFFVRTGDEWRDLVERNPFPKEARKDPARLTLLLLQGAPGKAEVEALRAAVVGRETLEVMGREAYIVFPDGMGTSKLTSALIERRLCCRATARNWNTVSKLLALASAPPPA